MVYVTQCRLEFSVVRNQASFDWNSNVKWFTLEFQCKLDYFQLTFEFLIEPEYLKIIVTISSELVYTGIFQCKLNMWKYTGLLDYIGIFQNTLVCYEIS